MTDLEVSDPKDRENAEDSTSDMAVRLDNCSRSFEASVRRRELIVYPSLLVFIVLAVGTILALASRSVHNRTLLAGVGLYLLYIIWVGGDFMSGRFLALPFAGALVDRWDRRWVTSRSCCGTAVPSS